MRFPGCYVVAKGIGMAAVGAMLMMLSGCAGFFVYPGTSSTTSSNSGDNFLYVSNSATGAQYLNGYTLSSSGTLTATTGSPYNLDYTPKAMVVSQNDLFLYVASDATLNSNLGYLYGYSISSTGQLSILSNGTALESENIAAMAISSDGKWLFCLDSDGSTIEYYSLNTSTGAVTYEATVTYTGAAGSTISPTSIAVAPSVDFVVAALGSGGMLTFPFNSSTGVAGPGQTLFSPASTANGVYAVTVDSNNNIYASGTFGTSSTSGVEVFSSTAAGVTTPLNFYQSGVGPNSIVLNKDNSLVFTGNQNAASTSSSISGFPISTGAVLGTAVATNAPEDLYSLGVDSTGDFLVAAGYNSSAGVQVYSIGSSGALTAVSSEPTTTSLLYPSVIALTH